MAITSVVLVESTPYRQRYLVSATTADPGDTVTIANATLVANLSDDPSGPLRVVVNTPTANQAAARAILNSDDPTEAILTNNNVLRAVLTITQRTNSSATINWAIDADAVAGLPAILVTVSDGTGTAYIDIHTRHTYDL
jgi:hypothetical protein